MEWGRQHFDVPLLIFFELFVIFQLVRATINGFDRVEREKVEDIVLVHLDGHSEGLFKH